MSVLFLDSQIKAPGDIHNNEQSSPLPLIKQQQPINMLIMSENVTQK